MENRGSEASPLSSVFVGSTIFIPPRVGPNPLTIHSGSEAAHEQRELIVNRLANSGLGAIKPWIGYIVNRKRTKNLFYGDTAIPVHLLMTASGFKQTFQPMKGGARSGFEPGTAKSDSGNQSDMLRLQYWNA